MQLSSIRPSHIVAGVAVAAVAGLLAFGAPWSAAASRGASPDVALNCGPHQQALVRQTLVGGAPQVTIHCVTRDANLVDAYGRPMAGAAAVPAAYASAPAAPRDYISDAAYVPRTAARPASTSTRSATTAPTTSRRSWQKTALVIGGSTGAGAGIGALIGGKKGALIGAAIGGGGATLFEATKR